ncbi:hypothetical protein L2E82_30579 [Cichorium intybus]|uniref:Uncharacterized protein n=1 Tax=Cichorium intybus TaxID=13427 RepID=A0ACB9D1G3_CICIN|nr:hypothetical protein L2E82_30579 [Cichorium intybus]
MPEGKQATTQLTRHEEKRRAVDSIPIGVECRSAMIGSIIDSWYRSTIEHYRLLLQFGFLLQFDCNLFDCFNSTSGRQTHTDWRLCVDTDEGNWAGWNWRTDGDIMVNVINNHPPILIDPQIIPNSLSSFQRPTFEHQNPCFTSSKAQSSTQSIRTSIRVQSCHGV